MSDEEERHDPHGECRREIHKLEREIEALERMLLDAEKLILELEKKLEERNRVNIEWSER